MTKDELKKFEARLLEERTRYMEELGVLEEEMNTTPRDSAGDLSSYSLHMADQGTDAMEREKTIKFATRDGVILQSINDALFRLHEGKYGSCALCNEPIHPERLDAVPHARYCSSCQEKEERGQR